MTTADLIPMPGTSDGVAERHRTAHGATSQDWRLATRTSYGSETAGRFTDHRWTIPLQLLPLRMPYTFEVDHDLHRSMSVITGVIKFDEAVAFIMERELFCALGYPLLVDVRSAQLSLSGRDIVRLLPHLQRLVEIAPLAPTAVVVEDKVNLRVVQLVAAMATNLCCIRSFSTTAKAEQWLGWNASSNSRSIMEPTPTGQTVG